MMNIRASYDSFREMRENQAVYVDKTEMIAEYLGEKFEKVVLFAHPAALMANYLTTHTLT